MPRISTTPATAAPNASGHGGALPGNSLRQSHAGTATDAANASASSSR